jgi:cob(I)alamin adenosyltransferase
MLYTRKGDDGTTKIFGCNQRMSKSSAVAEALGSLDEINSFLGVIKVNAKKIDFIIKPIDQSMEQLIHKIQESLFIIQAETAGFNKSIDENKVAELEKIVDSIETSLPPIKTFFISGGSELAASCDFARTLVRRAERRLVAVKEEGMTNLAPNTLAFMNRLSSVMYALARYSNVSIGVSEVPPSYK